MTHYEDLEFKVMFLEPERVTERMGLSIISVAMTSKDEMIKEAYQDWRESCAEITAPHLDATHLFKMNTYRFHPIKK